MRILSLITLLLFISCKKAPEKTQPITKVDKTQEFLDELVKVNKIPALNFSIIKSNGEQLNYSSGFENTATKTKMNASFFMFSGSIGKTYATALVMKLVDDGKIKLNDKILKHLPKEKWLDSIPNIDKITVQMLLSHTSGLPRWVMKPEVWTTLHEQPDKVWTYKDRLAYIFGDKPVHEPNEGWAYSDTNYILLGYLIETLASNNYYDVLKNSILEPSKLTETVPGTSRNIQNLAMGYSELPESFKIPKEVILSDGKFAFNPQMEWTGGGIASTASDLAKWGKIFFTSSIFSDSLRTKIITVNPNGNNVYQDIHSYGMGSFIYNTKHGKAYGHSGFMPGYNSIVAFYPEKNIVVALQANCDYAAKDMKLTTYLDKLIDSLDKN